MAYVYIPKEQRKKLDSKTQIGLFLGYDSETKAYRVYDQNKRKVIVSRDVVFDEGKVGYQYLKAPEPNQSILEFSEKGPAETETPNFDTNENIDF